MKKCKRSIKSQLNCQNLFLFKHDIYSILYAKIQNFKILIFFIKILFDCRHHYMGPKSKIAPTLRSS